MNNRFESLDKDQKERLHNTAYGWMVINLLKYGNTLVPEQAIRKSGLLRLVKGLDEELILTGNADVEIKIDRVKNEDDGKIDCIASLVRKEYVRRW